MNTPIGTIITSVLNFDAFSKEVGQTPVADPTKSLWLPCDGRGFNLDNTNLQFHGLQGGKVPDLRGMFLRGLKQFYSDNEPSINSEREKDVILKDDRTIAGEYQPDSLESHSHSLKFQTWKGNGPNGGDELSVATHLTNSRKLRTEEVGDNETRPKTVSVYYYIKVRN